VVEQDHPSMLVDAHQRRRRGAERLGQPCLGRPQPVLGVAPRGAGGGHRMRQLVELLDGEGAQRRRVAVADRAGRAGDGGGDVGDAAGDDDGQTQRDDEQRGRGDDPPRARRIRLEHEARRERAERQRRGEEEQQVRAERNRRVGSAEFHDGGPSNICTNWPCHPSVVRASR